jgi:hypothetical protein
MAELPVKNEAMNLTAAMRRLPAIAAKIASLDSFPPARFRLAIYLIEPDFHR